MIFIRGLAGLAFCLLMSGCISTSTGSEIPVADSSDAAELNYQLGARYYNSGKYDLARDRLLLAIKFDPDFATAYSTLGLAYEGLQNPRLAIEAYETAIDIAPKDAAVQNTYAVFLCRQGNFDDAADHFRRAAEIQTNDDAEVTLTNAGVCLTQKPDFVQAEAFFRQALALRPNYGEALLQMSVLKHQLEDDLIARAFLQRYLNSNVASPQVLYLGVQIEESLNDERAREAFADQIVREFPGSEEARRILDSD
jgi:type IV pilus assembly protein PilF